MIHPSSRPPSRDPYRVMLLLGDMLKTCFSTNYWDYGFRRSPGRRGVLSFFRRNIPYPRRMCRDIVMTKRQMDPLGRRRVFSGRYARPPFGCRPDRARDKTAAAVRAHIVQPLLGAVRAERALIAADARFRGIRRQIPVAIFAVRSQLQRHGGLVKLTRMIANQTRDSSDEYPSISATRLSAGISAAASGFPSADRARSRSAHAPRSGAASARC
jgi:PAS domain-containing protein